MAKNPKKQLNIIHKKIEKNPNANQPFGLGIFAARIRARIATDDGHWSYGFGDTDTAAVADAAKRIRRGVLASPRLEG